MACKSDNDCREEFGGMELTLVEEIDEKQHAMDQMKTLKSRFEENKGFGKDPFAHKNI